MAPKRAALVASGSAAKKVKIVSDDDQPNGGKLSVKVKSADEEEEVTPLIKLHAAMVAAARVQPLKAKPQSVVVYWSRNKDLRLEDNRALALASATAIQLGRPLVILHGFSIGDYAAHSRSPRRIDFQIRALTAMQAKLLRLNVPMHTPTWPRRKEVPTTVLALLEEWQASHLYANVEYEVDELGRDLEILNKSTAARVSGLGWGGQAYFVADFCVVKPGSVLTLQGKYYGVYSPFYKNWSNQVLANPLEFLGDAGTLAANTELDATTHPLLQRLLLERVPNGVEGYMLAAENQAVMEQLWPVGEGIVEQILHRFLKTKIRNQNFHQPPLQPGEEEVELKFSKVGVYQDGRNRIDQDGTSHLSAYLAAGLISPRAALRGSMELTGGRLSTSKDSGVGVWVSEIAWRDFYQHVLAGFPRVCRGRPFNLKMDTIVWEESDEFLQAWKDGKTGFPIVDAGMRCLKQQGYMHNRLRMIVAQFLSKDLMLDWRLGEKHFMTSLIDGDLGSNNGGWQWSASTGTDAQPYFRIFNPLAQSEKSDVSGDYIRHFVPELSKLKGKSLHDPSKHLSRAALATLGYPQPIVDHAKARLRAIARFKEPGTHADA